MAQINKFKLSHWISYYLSVFVFIIWIGFYLWLLLANKYHFFIQAKFKFLLIVAVVILILFVIAIIKSRIRVSSHYPTTARWLKGIFLCLPIYLITQVEDLTLGAYVFGKRNVFNRVKTSGQKNISAPKGNETLAKTETLMDSILMGNDTNRIKKNENVDKIITASIKDLVFIPENYLDYQVLTTGMFMHDSMQIPQGYFVLFRFMVSCCIADAQPLGILIKTENKQGFENNQWLEVQGTFHKTTIDDYDALYIIPQKIRKIEKPPPEKQYFSAFD